MHRSALGGRPRLALLAAIAALVPATTALAANAASAPAPAPADPLESAECQRALAVLSSEEAAVAASSRASGGVAANDRRLIDATLAPARRQAARACLARRADPATLPSQRLVRPPPVATAPTAVAPASSVALPSLPLRATSPTPPATSADRPYAITSCDAGGCWANDGSRLNRVGPNLWGPRGICSVQGSLVQCP